MVAGNANKHHPSVIPTILHIFQIKSSQISFTTTPRLRRRLTTMPAPCGTPRDALSACKRELGLHPRQCYPSSYKGQCDSAEFELKQCLAFAADPRDAKLLYDASRPREVRVAANARLEQSRELAAQAVAVAAVAAWPAGVAFFFGILARPSRRVRL